MESSVITFEKPIQHTGLDDWYAKQWEIQQTSDTRRNDAYKLRYESRQLRNDTRIRTEWNEYHNNMRLADRITELSWWKDILQACLDRVEKELVLLKEDKYCTERELDALEIPLDVISKCILTRDCRQGFELTYDDVETELKKELCVVEKVKKMLIERCQSTWEKMNQLEEIRFKLKLDINAKTETINIDKDQLALDKTCANISFKIDPLRISKNSNPYETWLEDSRNTKLLADTEVAGACKLREDLFISRERGRNDIKAQRDCVEFSLRKRIYKTQKLRNELDWELMKMREEKDKVLQEIQTLEDAFEEKSEPLKLCETRLENRTYRPGIELARDEVEAGLKDEVIQLRQTRKDLEDKLNCAKSTHNALANQQEIINRDLANKNHSLMTDIKCLDLRVPLNTESLTDTDRNIALVHLDEEIPRI